MLDIHLSFECQVNKILANMAMGIKTIILLRNRIPLRSRLQLLHSLVLSHLQYSVHLLGAISQRHILRLNRQINWGLDAVILQTSLSILQVFACEPPYFLLNYK